MNLTNATKYLLWAPAAVLALTLGGQVFLSHHEQPELVSEASWAFHPRSLRETRDRAHTIVRAQVVAVEKGEDLVVPARGEPSGEDRLPTQRITIKVTKNFKGAARPGQTLTLFQTGGEMQADPAPPTGRASNSAEHLDEPAGGKGHVHPNDPAPVRHEVKGHGAGPRKLVLEGDPAYAVGEDYVLMLEDGPKGLLRTVSPEGRFKVERNGSVKAMVTEDATKDVHGKPVAELERELAR
jgi:hypothetical protein